MANQNRDDFYEGPPLADEEHWHDGAIVEARSAEPKAEREAEHEAETATATDALLPAGSPYSLPEEVEHPHRTPLTSAKRVPPQPTRDPSLSRAVDRAAAGAPVEEAGYDRSAEGPPPGPLDPDAAARGRF